MQGYGFCVITNLIILNWGPHNCNFIFDSKLIFIINNYDLSFSTPDVIYLLRIYFHKFVLKQIQIDWCMSIKKVVNLNILPD